MDGINDEKLYHGVMVVHKKTMYRGAGGGGDAGEEALRQFAGLTGGLGKKRVVVFLRG